MSKVIGVLLNLGIVAYMGHQVVSCLGTEKMADINNLSQNPYILSFVAVVSLFLVVKNS